MGIEGASPEEQYKEVMYERRRSQMMTSIEDEAAEAAELMARRGSHSVVRNGHEFERRMSKVSIKSARSSVGGGSNNCSYQGALGTTTAEVLVSPNPGASTIEHLVLERRLSQLSANENEVFPASDLALTRSPRSSSVRRPSVNPPVISNPMPKSSPKNSLLLAPPTQEQLAQRRFSEVNAAIERHNMRKAAKRSQGVMYRPGQMPAA